MPFEAVCTWRICSVSQACRTDRGEGARLCQA
jgi:hypothetical protein